MREVIEAIDGPIMLNICLVSGKSCNRKATCPAHLVWERAQVAMLDVLSQAKIADMAADLDKPVFAHPVRSAATEFDLM